MEDEHFIVWMRTSGIPNFRKLWGKITLDLKPGNYYFLIENNYGVADFQARKSIVLANMNILGGKNNFLAVCYLVAGTFCAGFAITLFITHLVSTRCGDELNIIKKEQ